MDKLRNKGKCKSPTLFKVPNTPQGQFWDFGGHLEVILRSIRGQVQFFFEINAVQWISCRTKEKVSLQLYSKCQTHPKVNSGTLNVI